MVVMQCHFPQFADVLGNSVQKCGLLQVLLNLVDLNLQVYSPKSLFKKLFLVKSEAKYTYQQIADMVGISKASELRHEISNNLVCATS